MELTEHLLYWALFILLGAATYTDLKERLIYDRFVIAGLVIAIVFRVFYRPEPWWDYLLTGLGALLVLLLIAALTNEQSIGGGDVKLFAMLGIAVGWKSFFLIFFLSHVFAAFFMGVRKLVKWKTVDWKSEFPFAPFIFLATVFTYLFHQI